MASVGGFCVTKRIHNEIAQNFLFRPSSPSYGQLHIGAEPTSGSERGVPQFPSCAPDKNRHMAGFSHCMRASCSFICHDIARRIRCYEDKMLRWGNGM